MKKKNNVLITVLAIAVIILSLALYTTQTSNAPTDTETSDTGAIIDLMAYVNRASRLVASRGEAAFADFRNPASEWINGDSYVFVYDILGNTLVLPPQQNLEGLNRMNTADPKGEKYVKTMADILKTKNYGWNSYQYIKPGETTVSEKLSYFQKVTSGGQSYIVGSGIYLK